MKFNVGHLRSVISGLQSDREVEISETGINIVPKERVKLAYRGYLDIEKMLCLFESGKTLSEVAREMKTTRQNIRSILRQHYPHINTKRKANR